MKTLKISANVTAIMAVLSVFALIILFLALSDISHNEVDTTLEWYITGICMMILAVFIISTLTTLILFFRNSNIR